MSAELLFSSREREPANWFLEVIYPDGNDYKKGLICGDTSGGVVKLCVSARASASDRGVAGGRHG
jgi:hypothetical protein